MIKTIGKSLLIFTAIVCVVASGFVYLIYTESGAQLSYQLVKRYLPGTLDIKNIHGTLSKKIELDNITYRMGDKTIAIKSAELNWELYRLLKTQTTKLVVTISPGVITIPNDLTDQKHPFNGGKIITTINDKGTIAKVDLGFIDNSEIKGTINVPTMKKVSAFSLLKKINGKLIWTTNDVHVLSDIIPKINNLQGKLKATILISGRVGKPKIRTEAELSESKFKVPDIASQAENLQIKAKTEKKKINFTAKTNVGDGFLNATGYTDMRSKNFETHIHLTGDNARVIDMPLTHISASPKLDLLLSSDGLDITGDIFIPNGEIKTDTFSDTEKLPDDLIIETKKAKKPEKTGAFLITSNVDITLGNNIRISVDGLKGKISGNLKINENQNKPTTATGQLIINDGQFTLYGTTFNIENGRLNYHGGPITNPGLDIRATRSFNVTGSGTNQLGQEKITFGVMITGTVKKPKYTLFSEPGGYSQADILSYLFTGQPLQNLDNNDNKVQLLLQAAALVNIGGKGKLNDLRNQIKHKLGLSELDIQTSSDIDKKDNSTIQHTALILGKFLSPKLYLKYSFDILDHSNKLNVRYYLNKNWSIQTESSQSANSTNIDNGVDVLYTIERN